MSCGHFAPAMASRRDHWSSTRAGWSAMKGVEVLAQAWPQVRADATLVLAGDGPLRSLAGALPRARSLGPARS